MRVASGGTRECNRHKASHLRANCPQFADNSSRNQSLFEVCQRQAQLVLPIAFKACLGSSGVLLDRQVVRLRVIRGERTPSGECVNWPRKVGHLFMLLGAPPDPRQRMYQRGRRVGAPCSGSGSEWTSPGFAPIVSGTNSPTGEPYSSPRGLVARPHAGVLSCPGLHFIPSTACNHVQPLFHETGSEHG